MKKFVYAILFVLIICNLSLSQSGWVLQNPYPTGSMLFNSKFINDNTGYFVGGGVILKTINGGQSFINQSSPVNSELNSVWFTDVNIGYIAGGNIQGSGNDGVILKTNNGGNTWNLISSGLPSLWGITFINANTGFATGKNGTILRTVNAGQDWIIVNSTTNISLWSIIFVNDMTGFTTGGTFQPGNVAMLGDGLILKTTNGGNSWSQVLTGYGYTLFGISFPNQNTGYACGADGTILKTINGGSNWSILNSGTNKYLFSLHASDANIVSVCGASMSGNNGTVLRTINGGTTWNCCLNPLDTTSFYLCVNFSGVNTGYAVGNAGKIIKTVNGGANWTNLSNSITNNDVEGIFFKNDVGYGIAVDENNNMTDIIITTNGGSLWAFKNTISNFNANAIYFLDANTGFICGRGNNAGTVMKTTNGGNSWVTKFISSYPGTDLYTMYFADYNTGYVIASGVMDNYKTTDGGNTWNYFQISYTGGAVPGSSFINANTGYVAGGFGAYVAKTTNGCANWTVFQNVGNNLNTVFATDQNTAYASGENKIHKTTNSGQSWSTYTFNSYPNAEFKSIYFPNSNTGFVVGENGENEGLLFATTNAGITWNAQNYGQNSRLISVYFVSANTGYISGHDGLVMKTTSGGIGISNISTEVPSAFSLYQNYPNPFNPTTNIRFDVQKTGFISLKIYDILGNEVTTLVNEQLKPGTYEVDWDGSNFTSGIYFYKFAVDSYTETKKMILIK